MTIKKRYIVYLLSVLIIVLVACSKESNYKILSFIFDGVPEPELINIDTDTVNSIDTALIADTSAILPDVFVHQPYQSKECNKCHSSEIGVLNAEQPDLCYSCHIDHNLQLGMLHGPVAAGNCTACHDPHKSKYEGLVITSKNDICIYCHEQELLAENDVHSLIESSLCIECHDPHGEENIYFLKNGACFSCHDNMNETYKYLHGPVAAGFCNSCHDMHTSDKENKLLLTGQDLCYKCHKKERVLSNEMHEGIDDFDCTECHNPHGGEDKYILN